MYPPIPYPSLQPPPPTTKEPETPLPKRFKKFSTPFKTPAFTLPSPTPAASARPSSARPSSASTTPTNPRPKHKPFKPPSFSTPTTRTPAISLTLLERQLQKLKQARKYQLDELVGEDLEELGERWGEWGRIAAEMLFQHTSSSSLPLTTTPTPTSWSSTWGFSSPSSYPPSPPPTATQILSSWTTEATRLGLTPQEYREEVESEMREELPSLEELKKRFERGRGRKRVREEEVERCGGLGREEGEREEESGEEEKEWNIGSMMRSLGVDPKILGWEEDEGGFVRT